MTNCKGNNKLQNFKRKKLLYPSAWNWYIFEFEIYIFEFEKKKHMEKILLFILNGKWKKKLLLTISIHALAQWWSSQIMTDPLVLFAFFGCLMVYFMMQEVKLCLISWYSGNRNEGKSCQSLIMVRSCRAVQSNFQRVFSFSIWFYHCLKYRRTALDKDNETKYQANK